MVVKLQRSRSNQKTARIARTWPRKTALSTVDEKRKKPKRILKKLTKWHQQTFLRKEKLAIPKKRKLKKKLCKRQTKKCFRICHRLNLKLPW